MNTKKFTLFASLFAIIVLTVGFSACERVPQSVQTYYTSDARDQ